MTRFTALPAGHAFGEAPLYLLFGHLIYPKTAAQPRLRGAMLFGPMPYRSPTAPAGVVAWILRSMSRETASSSWL
jgi:hypothetical protein